MSRAPYEIVLETRAPPLQVTALRGDEAPTVTGGYGGWQEVARPLRRALTKWTGIAPRRMTVPLLLDGFADDESVEPECAALERMASPVAPGRKPPLVRVARGAVPHATLDWVIDTDGLAWGDAIWSRAGHRLRQAVVVTLLEHVASDAAAEAAAAIRRGPSPGFGFAPPRVYTVRPGDTLISIAAAQLGSYKRWHALARLNGIRDPLHLAVGTSIRLA